MLLHIVRTMANESPLIIAPAKAHFAIDCRPIIIATPAATMPTAASVPLSFRIQVQRPHHHRHTENERHVRRHKDHRCHGLFAFLPALVGAESRKTFPALCTTGGLAGNEKTIPENSPQWSAPTENSVEKSSGAGAEKRGNAQFFG